MKQLFTQDLQLNLLCQYLWLLLQGTTNFQTHWIFNAATKPYFSIPSSCFITLDARWRRRRRRLDIPWIFRSSKQQQQPTKWQMIVSYLSLSLFQLPSLSCFGPTKTWPDLEERTMPYTKIGFSETWKKAFKVYLH